MDGFMQVRETRAQSEIVWCQLPELVESALGGLWGV